MNQDDPKDTTVTGVDPTAAQPMGGMQSPMGTTGTMNPASNMQPSSAPVVDTAANAGSEPVEGEEKPADAMGTMNPMGTSSDQAGAPTMGATGTEAPKVNPDGTPAA